jgi:UDP-N-acetylglucosamine:LPS N-acetylglucosamine transferase
MSKGRILVAPLNWGLGHATRCIPIIKALMEEGFEPILASDGKALSLLEKEFPGLKSYKLSELKISYSKRGSWFLFKLFLQLFKFYKSYKNERQQIKKIAIEENLAGIISDNRLGLYHKNIPCAVITHQLKVYSGSFTWFSTLFHKFFISKYDQCWVPDRKERPNLSGQLGHLKKTSLNLHYIGYLSRFEVKEYPVIYDVLILISGLEPQRSKLEDIMLSEFQNYSGKVALVQGIVEDEPKSYEKNGIKVFNFLQSEELEKIIQQSKVIICRSGYSTLMDLGKLNRQAVLIPTPGQPEQQYLAKSMKKHAVAPYCQQEKFNLNIINDPKLYKGLNSLFVKGYPDFRQAFRLFERK